MKWFKKEEFKNYDKLSVNMLNKLDDFRESLGVPVRITSDYAENGHVENSFHYKGMAVDFTTKASITDVILKAIKCGFNGIGVYLDGYFHLDVRDVPCIWIGINKPDGNIDYKY